jgi:AraC family transcriptional regulator of adaptative response/methylated-DNA-[protein]-cysteine methyltransferase
MSSAADYDTVALTLDYLESKFLNQPSLDELSAEIGVSKFHLQRLFTRWAGVSPKRFLQFLTVQHAKGLLRRSEPVLATAFSAGLSGPARLHDLFVTTEGVTPGEYKTMGSSLLISYGFHPTPFGEALFGHTERGLCHLAFLPASGGPKNASREEAALARLRETWPGALMEEAPERTEKLVEAIFPAESPPSSMAPLSLFLKGTNFQIKVWEALLRIPSGAVTTYGGLARALGSPKSARAVGSAVAKNSLAFVIPCHRVIRQMGVFGDYRWGSVRKKAILGWESARQAG